MCRFMAQQGPWLFGKDIIYYSLIWNSSPYFPGPLTTSPLISMCCTIPEILKTILHGIKKSHHPPGTDFGAVITEPKKVLWTQLLVLNTSAMAKAIYSPQNALEVKQIVVKGEVGKVECDPRVTLERNPGFGGICRGQTALSISLPGTTVCQRGWKGAKTSHGSSRCQHSGICPFFLFFFPCTHPSFIAFNMLQFTRLPFDISKSWRDLLLLSLSSSTRPAVLTSPWCFYVFLDSIRMSSALSPRQQEQCLVARTLLENSINQ